jgi:hypothetical protein
MVRTQIALDEEMYRTAQDEARRQGISFAELCRRALALVLKREAEKEDMPWMRFAGSIDTGDPDSSISVDEVVYGRERP